MIRHGDRIVFCAGCKSAFLHSSWQAMGNKHCNQYGTISNFLSLEEMTTRLGNVPNLQKKIKFLSFTCILLGILSTVVGYFSYNQYQRIKSLEIQNNTSENTISSLKQENSVFHQKLSSLNKKIIGELDSSTCKPEPSTTFPDEFVREHYSLINKRQYETTWQRLTSAFQKKSGSYSEYRNWWDSVIRIDIGQVKVIEQKNDNAIVNAKLSYVMKRGDVVNDDKSRIYLVWSNNQNTWQIDNKRKY